jgi:hypothetical protein
MIRRDYLFYSLLIPNKYSELVDFLKQAYLGLPYSTIPNNYWELEVAA